MYELLTEYYKYSKTMEDMGEDALSMSKWLDLLGEDAQGGYVNSGNVTIWDLDR